MSFSGSPGTPSSSPPSSSVAPPSLHSRNASSQSGGGGNGGGGNNHSSTGGQNHSGIKLPDENSNMAPLVDRHESLSPASMDGSIYESGHMDERSAKSKIIFVISGPLIWYLVVRGKFKLPIDSQY